MAARVLLLLPTTSYKAEDFMEAARRLETTVVVGTDRKQALEDQAPGHTLALDFTRPAEALRTIVESDAQSGFGAVIATDDETTVLAAMAQDALGLPHNPVDATLATRDKFETRRRLKHAGMRTPSFRLLEIDTAPEVAAAEAHYPCVLKPRSLAASRGVLRADDPASFVRAFETIRDILDSPDVQRSGAETTSLLVEDYLPGEEVALEGLLVGGKLRPLALFDKPDPLEGPTFEERIYVTPSRHPIALQGAAVEEVARGCRALGLREGPVHAEVRMCRGEPWLLEVAARTIGGLCSRALRFGAGISLEELILRHSLGHPTLELMRERSAAGVMMIPVPRAGVIRGIDGLDAARKIEHVDELTLSVHVGTEVEPLPRGHRYLGFIIARADDPGEAVRALESAHAQLAFRIESPNPDL